MLLKNILHAVVAIVWLLPNAVHSQLGQPGQPGQPGPGDPIGPGQPGQPDELAVTPKIAQTSHTGQTSQTAQPVLTFITTASGSQDDVDTETTARLVSVFDEGLSSVSFSLEVSKGFNVTQAHYHCGAAGVSGPIVAYLYGLNPAGVNVNGLLSKGRLTNANILSNTTDFATTPACGITINNIASLYTAILQRLIYLNVHTILNPAGEVRGQVIY
jgi:hypothetical protein